MVEAFSGLEMLLVNVPDRSEFFDRNACVPDWHPELHSAFADGWHGFVRFCEGLTLFLAEALPTLILLALIGLGIALIVRGSIRRSRKKRRERAAVSQPAAPAPKPTVPNPTVPNPTVPNPTAPNPTVKDLDSK